MKITSAERPSRAAPADTAAARRVVRLTRVEAIPFALMNGLTDPFMIPSALEVNSCPIAQQDEIYRRVVSPLCN